MSPTSGDPGSGLTVSGAGWTPGDNIEVDIAGTQVCQLTADSSGSISGTQSDGCQVPTVPGGTQPLTAQDLTDGTTTTTGPNFTVTPAVSVSPTTGAPGNDVSVSGAGWTPGDQIRVQIGGATVCQLVADLMGEITGGPSDGCRVPPGLSEGSYPVTANDVTNGTSQATAPSNFTVPAGPSAGFSAPAPAPTGSLVAFTSTSTGTGLSYDWNWGDGTPDGSGATPSHTFTTADTYSVILTVTDSTGQTSRVSHSIQIEGPLTAAFTPTSATVPTGTPVSFDSTSSDPNGTFSSYTWDFRDGQTSTLPSPSHAYATAGSYTVILTVTDTAGNHDSIIHTVTVTDRPPVAAFTPSGATVLAGSNVGFDGTGSSDPDGTITAYSWSFGDGGTSTAAKPTHAYMKTGTFTVTLTVTDNSGNASSVTHQITVIAPPPLQTLILTPVANPSIVKWRTVSATHSGRIDLGKRLFCVGPGPSCTAHITATSKALARHAGKATAAGKANAGRATITVAPNASAELTFKLSRRAFTTLRKHHRLAVRVKIKMVRGNVTKTSVLNIVFVSH